ncbi:hypothetical protein PIB30_062639 [Stylosanthes scabra]|uniref:Cytochrome P450 n=1 Tax=Stylosanthes scabra TaxID=79078 RepID=A0ABU6VLE7_9FABA|nr:hypothetical protein [Stylosanthes scabra]
MILGKKYMDRDLDEKGFKAVMQEILQLAAIPNVENKKDKAKNFVDVMLSFLGTEESEYRIEPSNIKAILLDMLVGSMNTSATAIEWAISELIKHPRVMKKLQMELESVVGMNRIVEESDWTS